MRTLMRIIETTGRFASSVLPLGIVIGLLVPSLAESLQPFLYPALLVPLALSLVRIKTKQLRRTLIGWHWVALLCFWILLLRPVVVWFCAHFFTLPESITQAALLTAAAPPVTACAAIAIFLDIDAALTVIITVATMLLIPFTLPTVVGYLLEVQLKTELWYVSLQLAGFIGVAYVIAACIRRWMGQARIIERAATLDGISVIFISIFVIGIMRGAADKFLLQPWYVVQVLVVSTILVLGLYIISTLLFWRLGPRTALAVGLVSGNANMGLMYLIMVDKVSLDLLIFFAIGQIPMYFLPAFLAPIIKRIILPLTDKNTGKHH